MDSTKTAIEIAGWGGIYQHHQRRRHYNNIPLNKRCGYRIVNYRRQKQQTRLHFMLSGFIVQVLTCRSVGLQTIRAAVSD